MNKLRRGDKITLTMPYGRFTYSVEGLRVVRPEHVGVLKHVRHNRLVLTTCPRRQCGQAPVASARLERAVAADRRSRWCPRCGSAALTR
jgi:sortase A